MKKGFILFSILLLGFIAKAQTIPTIQIGMNKASVWATDIVRSQYIYLVPRYAPQFGLFLEQEIGKIARLETGLLFTTKGLKEKDGERYLHHLQLNYFEFQYNIRADFPMSESMYFCAFVGPYVAIATSGYRKVSYNGTVRENEHVTFGNDPTTDLKRLDYGGQLGFGMLQDKGLMFKVTFSYGVLSFMPPNERGLSLQNRVVSFSIAYRMK